MQTYLCSPYTAALFCHALFAGSRRVADTSRVPFSSFRYRRRWSLVSSGFPISCWGTSWWCCFLNQISNGPSNSFVGIAPWPCRQSSLSSAWAPNQTSLAPSSPSPSAIAQYQCRGPACRLSSVPALYCLCCQFGGTCSCSASISVTLCSCFRSGSSSPFGFRIVRDIPCLWLHLVPVTNCMSW